MSVRSRAAAMWLVAVLLSACTVPGSGSNPSPTGSLSPTSVPSESSSSTPSPSVTEGDEPSITASPDPTATDPTPTTRVITTKGGQSVLRLADVFDAGDWQEGVATPAGTSEGAQSIYVSTACGDPETLELRFGGVTGSIEVSVAQAADSPSSDSNLEWSLIADGRTVDTKAISFKERRTLTTRLDGVAAVKVSVNGKRPCKGAVTALITRLLVTTE